MYWLTSTFNFIPDLWKTDGTYNEETWPAEAILLTEEEVVAFYGVSSPPGKRIGIENGRPAWVDIVLTPEQELAQQSAALQGFTQLAAAQKNALTERISQIKDAIDFGDATPAEEEELPVRILQLAAWKRYSTLLGRVTAQAGWHETVIWPAQPTEGMDLTVSAVSPGSPQLQ